MIKNSKKVYAAVGSAAREPDRLRGVHRTRLLPLFLSAKRKVKY
jgi:hypothetical protein